MKQDDKAKTAKQVLLLAHAGLPPFYLQTPMQFGKPHKSAKGFWLKAGTRGERILKVSASRWTKFAADQPVGNRGGSLILGLSGVKGKKDVERIEAYAPDLINEALGKVLGSKVGWTIGQFGFGRYVADDGTVFDERSTTIRIAGVASEQLKEAAKELARQFNQSYVMVYDDNEGAPLKQYLTDQSED